MCRGMLSKQNALLRVLEVFERTREKPQAPQAITEGVSIRRSLSPACWAVPDRGCQPVGQRLAWSARGHESAVIGPWAYIVRWTEVRACGSARSRFVRYVVRAKQGPPLI